MRLPTVGDILDELDAESEMSAPTNEENFRSAHVGASEVAALFDLSPWLTRYQLWHRKAGNITAEDLSGDSRVEAGIRLERAILDWACDKYGYRLVRYPGFRLSNGRGLGGHPDGEVTAQDRDGPGIIEVKTADWLVARNWGDEPPAHYLMQVQTYMGLAGCTWGDIVVLVGGNELRRFRYDFRPALFAKIEGEVEAFWRTVRAREAPEPDYRRDGKAIASVLGEADNDAAIDLVGDNRAAELAATWLRAKERAKAAEAEVEAARAELLEKMGAAAVAFLDGFIVRAGMVKGTPDRPARPGEIIKGRRAFRRFDIREKGE
jgi:predicted phage-related endonuclease